MITVLILYKWHKCFGMEFIMKKKLAITVFMVLVICTLAACGTKNTTASVAGATDKDAASKMSIVTTIFPEYDWVKAILGDEADRADITMLLDNGVDLHSYQPTAEDILKISTCDVFIYVGGESDEWVEDALKEAVNKDMKVINLLDVLGDKVKEEEIVEGMEADHDHEHEHGDEDHDEDEHEHEGEEHDEDEHVWLSLRNAQILCDKIAETLEQTDPEYADTYKKNADEYKQKLDALDKEYEAAVASAAKKTLLFGDRFPFRYMTDDYGLDYYAAFAGCSAETEASFETVIFLAEKTDELGLNSIMTIEGTDKRIAETVRDNTQDKAQQILTLDSMQGTTSEDVSGGTTYISVMTDNLTVLKEALS